MPALRLLSLWRRLAVHPADGQTVSVRVSGNLLTTNGEALRRAALDGHGIFMAPGFIAGEDLAAGRLVRVNANVSFRITSGPAGQKKIVAVKFRSTPAGDVASIKSKVDEIVNHTFRSHVDRVDVAF